jgi:hypothetical protein
LVCFSEQNLNLTSILRCQATENSIDRLQIKEAKFGEFIGLGFQLCVLNSNSFNFSSHIAKTGDSASSEVGCLNDLEKD